MKKKKRAEKIIDAIGLPKDTALMKPTITISGNNEISIINYGGIIDYDENFMSFSTSAGVMELRGKDLVIKEITDEDIAIIGEISGFEIK